jgi:hypothetical protein
LTYCSAGFSCSQQSFYKYKVLSKPVCNLKKPDECSWQIEEKMKAEPLVKAQGEGDAGANPASASE